VGEERYSAILLFLMAWRHREGGRIGSGGQILTSPVIVFYLEFWTTIFDNGLLFFGFIRQCRSALFPSCVSITQFAFGSVVLNVTFLAPTQREFLTTHVLTRYFFKATSRRAQPDPESRPTPSFSRLAI